MSKSQTVGSWVLVAGVVLLAGAGYSWRRSETRMAPLRAHRAATQADLDSTRTRLYETTLRYRGFAAGQKAIPDSLRRIQMGITLERSRTYEKRIGVYEFKERDLSLDLTRYDKVIGEEKRAGRTVTLPLALAGVVAVLAGAVLRRRPAPVAS
jgi:hypothetical protein